MGKLTGEALAFVAEHMRECRKAGGALKRQMVVTCDSSTNAKTIVPWLKSLWGAEKIVGDIKKESSIKFEYMWQRDQAVEQINAEVNAYRLAHPELIVPTTPQTPETPTQTEPDPDEPEKEAIDWTTYIVIGVAAVAIILLIWPKRKKR